MADPIWTSNEEHGGGKMGGEDHGVMACSAGHRAGWCACGDRGFGEDGGEVGVQGDGRLIEEEAVGQGDVPLGGCLEGGFCKADDRLVPDSIVGVAKVKECSGLAGDDVSCSGRDFEAAHGGYEVWGSFGEVLDLRDPLGGGGEGVAAERHRSCAGVVGLASKGELHAGLANQGGDQAEREIEGFENGGLARCETRGKP